MLSRFHLIPERYGRTNRQTDRWTDGQICYINIAHQHKNENTVASFISVWRNKIV